MKTGTPPLRSKPPGRTDDLDRLNRLNDWTEEPAKTAASAISKPEQPQAATSPQKPAGRPWDAVSGEGTKLVSFKLPMHVYARLKWLGDTTFNSSMTKIVIAALEKEIDAMMRGRGDV